MKSVKINQKVFLYVSEHEHSYNNVKIQLANLKGDFLFVRNVVCGI